MKPKNMFFRNVFIWNLTFKPTPNRMTFWKHVQKQEYFVKVLKIILIIFRSSRMARICERLGSRSSEYFSDFSNKQNHVSSNGSRVFYGRGYATAKNRRRHLSISWHFAPFDAKVYQFCHYVWDLLSIYKTVVRYDRS